MNLQSIKTEVLAEQEESIKESIEDVVENIKQAMRQNKDHILIFDHEHNFINEIVDKLRKMDFSIEKSGISYKIYGW